MWLWPSVLDGFSKAIEEMCGGDTGLSVSLSHDGEMYPSGTSKYRNGGGGRKQTTGESCCVHALFVGILETPGLFLRERSSV